MNRTTAALICGMMACGLLTSSFLTGCKKKNEADVLPESVTTVAETQQETMKEETLPAELLDPTGHYVYAGVGESVWDDEIPVTEAEQKSETNTKTDKQKENVQPTEATKSADKADPTETTAPVETTEPAETTKPTEVTQPAETTPATEPNVPETEAARELTEYEKYMAMSPSAQEEFFNSFGSVDAFFQWMQSAKAEYEASLDYIEIGGGPIDIEGVLSGNEG